EGLFLSSGIVRSADHTMEQVIEVARQLREVHHFRGYIHLKTIPEASQALIDKAGRYADRISINIELPSQQSLDRLAPEKNLINTKQAMHGIRQRIDESLEAKKVARQIVNRPRVKAPAFATGQSTQMIVGADDSSDALVLHRADELYREVRLRRVYYSGFSPIPEPSVLLPIKPPPLVREHRLYQADWLLRFYGFDVGELLPKEEPNLDLDLDPKLAWALRNRAVFPVDINRASQELLWRIPGLGTVNVARILAARRWSCLTLADLQRMRVNLKKVMPFIIAADHRPRLALLESTNLRQHFLPGPRQLELNFNAPPPTTPADAAMALSGQI
ncbi:MAG: putative DNA modification/repair radical SAM protein, partial [Verrucomicrobiaceae bacterium]|nr:putative DNA modification/repair radical SAM protein [Verrucomicrobiaceae bacterium]